MGRHVTSCRYLRLCSGPDTTGKWNISIYANSCNLSGVIHQNQPRRFSFIFSVHLKELKEKSYFIIGSCGVKYEPSFNKETNYWKIWVVKHDTHCFVLPQFYVVLCRGCAKEKTVSHMGFGGNCEGGMAVALRGRNGYIRHIFTYSPTLQYKVCLLCVNQRRKKGEYVEEMARKVLEDLHLPIYAKPSLISHEKKNLCFFEARLQAMRQCDYIHTSSIWNIIVETKVFYYSVCYIALNHCLRKYK